MCALTTRPDELRFAVDRSLGRLARWLRRLGFDTVLRPEFDRHRLETLAAREGRVLLTRTPARQRTPERARTLVLEASGFREQLREIDAAHPLGGWEARARRCLSCNVVLEPRGDGTWRCLRCRRTLTAGGHDLRMEKLLGGLSLRRPDGV